MFSTSLEYWFSVFSLVNLGIIKHSFFILAEYIDRFSPDLDGEWAVSLAADNAGEVVSANRDSPAGELIAEPDGRELVVVKKFADVHSTTLMKN